MKFLTLLAALTTLTLAATPAVAELLLYDFEEFDATSHRNPTQSHPGTLTTLASTRGFVTMTITRTGGEGFDLLRCDQGDFPEQWGTRALDPFHMYSADDWFLANFSMPIFYASLQLTDFGRDDDTAYMEIYEDPDGAGAMVAAVDEHWGTAATPDFVTLAYQSEQAFMSIKFRGYGLLVSEGKHFPNGMYIDNLTVSTTIIPEPATAALMGLGLAAMVMKKRSRK